MMSCDFDSRFCFVNSLDDLMPATIDSTSTNNENINLSQTLTKEIVPLRSGPPTKEEMLVYYPGKFTWNQLKTFINSGDLGLLKRDKALQSRYLLWGDGIREQYGSMVNYLLTLRLQWGKRDRLSLLPSTLDSKEDDSTIDELERSDLPKESPSYFRADAPPELISIIMNDWPYSVPSNVEHSLIWTRLPIYPPNLPESIKPRIDQDGLWGFTGNISPPPSPSTLPACLPALSEWGVTMDKLIRSPKPSEEEEELVRKAGEEIATFVKGRWNEREWETAWFVNPPRLQSVPGLAHIHVFARFKEPAEIDSWQP
ncbi:Protein of unknown function DUF3605 [Abortiporus biennis]